MMTVDSRLVAEVVGSIRPPSQVHAERARQRQDVLTKPTGALGRLESLAISLAGLQRTDTPQAQSGAVVIFAADHGVARHGVSAYPSAVTAQMVHNFAAGGAAVNVLARSLEFDVHIVDCGVAGDVGSTPGLIQASLGPGTNDLRTGPAMSQEQATRGIEIGIEQARRALLGGRDVFVPGEMGIGNTTAAAALGVVLTGESPDALVGRGTGLSDEQLPGKVSVVREALECNQPSADDPLAVAAALGGFEIAAAAGSILAAAALGVPVILDGFIIAAAALLAVRLAPAARAYCLAGHRSEERGHALLLKALGLDPILDVGMRLGEGSGALVSVHVLRAACRLHNEMATFEQAGVSDRA